MHTSQAGSGKSVEPVNEVCFVFCKHSLRGLVCDVTFFSAEAPLPPVPAWGIRIGTAMDADRTSRSLKYWQQTKLHRCVAWSEYRSVWY